MVMNLEEQAGARLVDEGLTLATAESCTGGLVAHRITNVSGSSAYYLGGFVTYSNELKEALLGVRHETLLAHGAVSEETAREMAQGARKRTGADISVAVTGIAGPTGGTPEKPVGLVYIALSAPDAELGRRHLWRGDRLSNKEQSAKAVLQLIVDYLGTRSGRMFEFVNEPISVEVQVRQDGTVRPLAFVWHGRRMQIVSWGRQSSELQDGCMRTCHLVQTADLETWELCQDTNTAQWTLGRHWGHERRAV
jgi:nicotinamide-nucleotide amidase